MRITKISVKKLFGVFDHEIPLNQESRITIIHGPNGVGKTVLLRMVHGLFHYDYELLERVPFEHLLLEFNSNETIAVMGGEMEGATDDGDLPRMVITSNGIEDREPFVVSLHKSRALSNVANEVCPHLKTVHLTGTEISSETYWVSEEGPSDDAPEVKYRVYNKELLLREFPSIHEKVYGKMPPWFVDMQQESVSTLISTMRLKRYPMDSELTFALYTRDHMDQDRSYILTNPMDAVTELRFNAFRNRNFVRLGESEDSVMMFLDAVNSLLQHKEVRFGKHGELKILARDGEELKLETLSSGEQHVLILYHQLHFEINPDTLVMIDEPELSMHVNWQEQFLDDIKRVSDLRKLDVLIATHSPDIISDKHEWMVELGDAVLA